MRKVDLILLHPPSVYDFRKKNAIYGPVSDVVPSTPIFEMYPIGFLTIVNHLRSSGYSVRIINVALKMLRSRRFDVEKLIESLNPRAFGLDLHWLVHAQGGLELASIVKRYHPHTPVIFGGLSASYYHQELILYPQVDYVLRGDSTEQPLGHLLKMIRRGGLPESIPNLTWQDGAGRVHANVLSHVPADLDDLSFDYRGLMVSSVQHKDIVGHAPFRDWFDYPIVGILPWRGCKNSCLTCGGADSTYKMTCGRNVPAYRSPRLLAEDIGRVCRYLGGPIFMLGDIRHAGEEYVEEFLGALKKKRVTNDIVLELSLPPSREFLAMVARSIPKFSLEISPESHDENVRGAFGRGYSNDCLESSIGDALELGCRRVDLFFMIGLPHQTPESVRGTIKYCEVLLRKFSKNRDTRIRPYISPLAPFLDPGSRAFEDPEKYGYRLFYKTLEQHRQALVAPSWKYVLNYETKWMSRDELVASTYEAAFGLNHLKMKYGLVRKKEGHTMEMRIRRATSVMLQVDEIMAIGDEKLRQDRMDQLHAGLPPLNGNATICREKELRWPVKSIRFNLPRIIWAALGGK